MFTGIIVDVGIVAAIRPLGADRRLCVQSKLAAELRLGGSISVNGVCLTVTDLSDTDFTADVSAETLRCTTLGALQAEDAVNLEPAMTAQTALGGHFVSGHVDATGQVAGIEAEGRSFRYAFNIPGSLSRYIAAKGSITVDGVSLTVNRVDKQGFEVNIVPHTLERTVFRHYRSGTPVNLEVDLLARYLERLLESREV
ncbi:MAG TPA: riboflavin synthase [Gammaproteobacteria bacterium]|nr:riboflavin synthase [Gammaproteobacteria bacterium]